MVRRTLTAPVQRTIQALEFSNGGYRLSRETDGSGSCRQLVSRFEFELCRKQAQFGDVPVDQFWFAHGSLYGQRKSAARNRQPISECFWSLCWREGSVLEDDIQETYILLKLLPHARSNGSRRVFKDAVLARTARSQVELIANLNASLSVSTDKETDLEAFRDQTAVLLGPPEYSDTTWRRYKEMEQELLGEGRSALQRSGEKGLTAPLARWQEWMRKVARRSGNAEDKQILDIFSYECRTALHRAYSAVWAELLPQLADRFQLTHESQLFHRLWHLDLCGPPLPGKQRFHLFHGHVFGLHAGTALFAQTQAGAELIGAALREGDVGPAFRRLLSGLLVALHDYADRGETMAQVRKTPRSYADNAESDEADFHEWKRRKRDDD